MTARKADGLQESDLAIQFLMLLIMQSILIVQRNLSRLTLLY